MEFENNEINQSNETTKIINKKRYFMYENIYEDNDKLLEAFFFKIKPIEGIVTYKINNWLNLPKIQDDAIKLAKEWSKKMIQNEKYNKFSVIIFFHLEYNTIRFELTEIIKLEDIKTIKEFEEKIITKLEADKNIYLYNLENVEDFPDLINSKELAKKWAKSIEERLQNKKVIVLLNEYKKSVKLTFTFQIKSEK
jgi:hypothetical protein